MRTDVTTRPPGLEDMPGPGASDATLTRFLHGLPGVDQVGAEGRAAQLATRSIKDGSKDWALDTIVRMTDLTTLEGADTPGKVRALARKGITPDPDDPTCPPVAAICVYPDMVADVAAVTAGTGVAVAAVATAFPAGRAALDVKLSDTRQAVADGADEIDMVIDRGAFLSGRYAKVLDEVVAVKEACGPSAHLKVILETGELATLDNVRRASVLAMIGGADFIKTSTGKVNPASTRPVTLVMLQAVVDFHAATGRAVGVKSAGGIRTSKDAIRYLVMVNETAGEGWLTPDRFRFGASSLLNDVLLQRRRRRSGVYEGPDYVTID
ncbi:deoxyribose-phosphate aldolase [Euzebya sp.]|uniref:deoxyribose-phosphate aldolase n=1 Tax=Euzebya sp. TaxID=1971409 RepID=UPI0035187A0C